MTYWTKRLLDEEAVYWEPPIRDGLGGYSKWRYPEQIRSRWEYSGPRIDYSVGGSVISARTTVWIDREIEIGSYLYKGTINDLQTVFRPDPDFIEEYLETDEIYEFASQVVSVENVRSIPSKKYLYEVHLDET